MMRSTERIADWLQRMGCPIDKEIFPLPDLDISINPSESRIISQGPFITGQVWLDIEARSKVTLASLSIAVNGYEMELAEPDHGQYVIPGTSPVLARDALNERLLNRLRCGEGQVHSGFCVVQGVVPDLVTGSASVTVSVLTSDRDTYKVPEVCRITLLRLKRERLLTRKRLLSSGGLYERNAVESESCARLSAQPACSTCPTDVSRAAPASTSLKPPGHVSTADATPGSKIRNSSTSHPVKTDEEILPPRRATQR